MSKDKAMEALPNNIDTIDFKFDLNEVTNVFIAQYEDQLTTRRKELSEQVKEAKAKAEKFRKKVLATQRKLAEATYITSCNILGIASKVSNVDFGHDNNVEIIEVQITIYDTSNNARSQHYSSFSKHILVAIDADDELTMEKQSKAVKDLSAQLQSVIHDLNDMSRKERSVRAKISERRLKEQGFDMLFADKELLKLIEVS